MATVVYCDAGGGSARYQLRGNSVLIGRTEQCEIRTNDAFVGATHARLSEADGQFWIEDLTGRSSIVVGGTNVSRSQVPVGELVIVGSLVFRVEVDPTRANKGTVDPNVLARLLDAGLKRQQQLEEERNALGQRLGELHKELAAAQNASPTPPSQQPTAQATPTTANVSDSSHAAVEDIVRELRAAEKARDAIVEKIRRAENRRVTTESELSRAESEALGGDSSEMEVRQVQALALSAQAAEAKNSVDRLRRQLETRNRDIAVLRARAKRETSPRTTRSYASTGPPPADSVSPDENAKAQQAAIETLRRQLQAERVRSQTFQKATAAKDRTLKQMVADIAEAKASLEGMTKENDSLRAELKNEKSSRASKSAEETKAKEDAESKVSTQRSLEREAAAAVQKELDAAKTNAAKTQTELKSKVAELEARLAEHGSKATDAQAKVDDLKKLIESARRDVKAARSRADDREAELQVEIAKRTEIEEAQASVLAEANAGAEAAAKQVDELKAQLAEKVDELATTNNALATKDSERQALTAQLKELEESGAEAASLSQRLDAFEVERASLRSKVEAAEQEKVKARTERRELDARLVKSESRVGELEAKLELAERRYQEAVRLRETAEAAQAASEAKLSSAMNARDESAAELERIQKVRNEDNTQIRSLREKLSDGEHQAMDHIERLEKRLRELETDLDRALDAEQAALAKADADCAGLAETVSSLEGQLRTAQDRKESLEKQVAEHKEKIRLDGLKIDELELSLSSMDNLRTQASERTKESETLDVALRETRSRLEEQGGEFEALKTELAETRLQLERGEIELEAAKRETEAAKETLGNAKTELENAQKQLAKTEQEMVARDNQAQASGSEQSERVIELASQNAQMSSELSSLREQLDGRDEELKAASGELSTLREQLAAHDREQVGQTESSTGFAAAEEIGEQTRQYDQAALEALENEASKGSNERSQLPPSSDLELEAANSRIAELERELGELVKDRQTLRDRVAELEVELVETIRTSENAKPNTPSTETGNPPRLDTMSESVDYTAPVRPVVQATEATEATEWLEALNVAIGDLRKQMRTASDEAAVMEGDRESLDIVNESLSQAVVRVESARDAIAQMATVLGVTL